MGMCHAFGTVPITLGTEFTFTIGASARASGFGAGADAAALLAAAFETVFK